MWEHLRLVRDMVLPPSCAACGEIISHDRCFCVPCWLSVRRITDPRCNHCGLPLFTATDGGADATCLRCRLEPPPWQRARAPWDYEGAVRALVLRLKSGRRPDLVGVTLAPLTHAAADLVAARPLVVPVPLYRWRLWRRGYNQAALLAHGFARAHGLDLCQDALIRTRPTAQSSGLSADARRRNVAGAFVATSPEALRGRAILLIDDVLTSGATAAACTRALRRAGAASVDVLTLARVVGHGQASDIRAMP